MYWLLALGFWIAIGLVAAPFIGAFLATRFAAEINPDKGYEYREYDDQE